MSERVTAARLQLPGDIGYDKIRRRHWLSQDDVPIRLTHLVGLATQYGIYCRGIDGVASRGPSRFFFSIPNTHTLITYSLAHSLEKDTR
jgi:hypothetical protein